MVDIGSYQALALFEDIVAERNANRKVTERKTVASKSRDKHATVNKCSRCENHGGGSEAVLSTKYKGCMSYGPRVSQGQRSLYWSLDSSSPLTGKKRCTSNFKGTKEKGHFWNDDRTSGISSASGVTTTINSDGPATESQQVDVKSGYYSTYASRNNYIKQQGTLYHQNNSVSASRSDRSPSNVSQSRLVASVQSSSNIHHSRKTSDLSTISVNNESISSHSAAMFSTVQPSGAMYCTLPRFSGRSHPGFNQLSTGDKHLNICNTFWRAGLAFSSYQMGDKPVGFGSLWPKRSTLESLIWEAYYNTSLKKSVLELCRLGICCGPFHVVETMVILNIIGLNTRFENGGSLLHLSCIAKNYEAVTYICEHGGDKQITDKQGRTPSQVCDSVKILKVMGPASQGHSHQQSTDSSESSTDRVTSHNISVTKSAPTLYEKQLMFEMATIPTDVDELLLKIQTYDFDVNEEYDENGDFLIHLATREGISQLPLLIPLVRMFNADIDLPNRSNYTSLMLAAESGDHVILDVMMCVLGANPNIQQTETSYTALHLCCLQDHADCVRVLLTRGADFNLEDKERMRPDDLAMKVKGQDCDSSTLIQKSRSERMAKLKELIEEDKLSKEHLRSTDLFVTDPVNGFTLVMMAAYLNKTKSLRTLLNWDGAPVNAQHGKTMQTALSFAAEEGNVEAMQVLIEKQANPAILDLDRLIPLHHAVKNNHVDFVNKLLEHRHCLLGLELASRLASTDIMRKTIKSAMTRRQREIVTPTLFECTMSGDAERLYNVLEEGDCVSPVSGFGQWPLYLAVENGHLPVVRLLCECGADLHRKHRSTGNTVLHLSSSLGLYDITSYLLTIYSKSWSPDTIDINRIVHLMNYDGKTPLMLAAAKGWSNVVDLLLSYGSSTSVLNFRGELYTCKEFEGSQSVMENHRASHTKAVMEIMKKRDSLRKLQQVFLPRFDHNLRDENGDTPLMVACQRQNIQLVQFLLESAVYVVEHQKNFQGSFARSYASSRTVSDSGRHSPPENYCSSSSDGCCHQTSRVEAEIHHVDSYADDGFLEKSCVKQSCEDVSKPNEVLQQDIGNTLLKNVDSLKITGLSAENDSKCVESFDTNGMGGREMYKTVNTEKKCSCGDGRNTKNKLGIYLGSDKGCQCERCLAKATRNSCQKEKTLSDVEGATGNNIQGLPLHTIVTETGYIPEDKEYEDQIQENISALFTSIHSVNNRGSIFITEIMISHLCAKSLTNGATCFHRLISAGDNVQLLTLLLDKDKTGINLQDVAGLAPIHLAAQLGRKKIVNKMTSLSYIDLNVRTLDGRLPEEMTKDTAIQQLLKKSRAQEPEKSVLSPLFSSLSTSVFGAGSYAHTESDSLNFDRTHQQYMDLKQNLAYNNEVLDQNNTLLIGMM